MGSRVICRLLGCVSAKDPCCDRCGADLYEDFIQEGRLDPLFRAWWIVRKFVRKLTGKKCEVCRRRYWVGYDELVCSDKCFTDWLPF